MPRKITKDLFTKTKDKLAELNKNLQTVDVNKQSDAFNKKYNEFMESQNLSFSETPEKQAEILALYLFASNNNLPSKDSIFDYLMDSMAFGLKTLQSFEKTYKDPNFKIEEFTEINDKGKVVLNTKEYQEKEKQERANQRKATKEREKTSNETYKKIKEEFENEKKAKEAKEQEEGKKIWADLEKKEKAAPKKERKQVFEYKESHVAVGMIENYIKIAQDVYSNKDNRHIKNSTTFFKNFDESDIAFRLNHLKAQEKECTVSNVIDRIGMYKAQKEKLNSMGWFRRNFSFFFKDARTIKSNLSKIENSFGEKLTAKEFKDIANAEKPHLALKNAMGTNYAIKYKDKATESMFGPNRDSDSRYNYLKSQEDMLETGDFVQEKIRNEQEEERKFQEHYNKIMNDDRQQLDIDDKLVSENEGKVQQTTKENTEPSLENVNEGPGFNN